MQVYATTFCMQAGMYQQNTVTYAQILLKFRAAI